MQVAYCVHELILPIQPIADEPMGPDHPAIITQNSLKQLPGVLEIWMSPKGDYILLDVDGDRFDLEKIVNCLEENGLAVGELQWTVMEFSDWS